MKSYRSLVAPSLIVALMISLAASAEVISVRNSDGLQQALNRAKPGSSIRLAAGIYRAGVHLRNVSGSAEAPIVIEGAGVDKVIFQGGRTGIQLSDCNYLTLRNFSIRHCSANGLNLDDGGSFDTPSRGMVVENLSITDIGPRGNWDALKMSGLTDFTIRNCSFRGWGGSAIDMVGCRSGVVDGVTLTGAGGYSQATGIQMKGGCRDIVIRNSFFDRAGSRAINLGGSTGLQYFRPKVDNYEATAIEVVNNRFVGGMAAIAYVTAIGGNVHHNLFYLPEKWVFRILQESKDARFAPCRDGRFHHNVIVYDKRLRIAVNIGGGVAADSFSLDNNLWFAVDGTRLNCPLKQSNLLTGIDPELVNAGKANARIGSSDPRLRKLGPQQAPPPAK